MSRGIAFILALLLAGVALAGQATLSWTPPTEREDNTALDNLAGYNVFWGLSSGAYTETAAINDPATVTYVVQNLEPGTWYFVVTAFDATGLESAYSAEASKTIETALPKPPGSLVVLAEQPTAYGLVQSVDRFALVPVGEAVPGTVCDDSQLIRDSNGVQGYVVPRDSVEWAGTVRPQVVVVECG